MRYLKRSPAHPAWNRHSRFSGRIRPIGDFLAYQFATDLNYGNLTDFSEMEFVVPGPGALDGIRKCFSDLGGLTEADAIKAVHGETGAGIRETGHKIPDAWEGGSYS